MSHYKLAMPHFKLAMSHSRIASPKSKSQIKYFYRIVPHYDPNRKKIC